MIINENYFYFNFKKTKNICNLVNIENSSNLAILEDKIIQLLKDDLNLLLDLVFKNKNILFKIINIFCNDEKIDGEILSNFINSILLEDKIDKDEIKNFILYIYQNSFFTNNNAKFLLSRFFYIEKDFIDDMKIDNLLLDIEHFSFYEIIQKYKIIEGSNIYIFIDFYKNIIYSNKIISEDVIENKFIYIVKPVLNYLKNNLIIIKRMIEFFSRSRFYKNYISTILDFIFTSDNFNLIYNNIENYFISKECLIFIKNYLNNKFFNNIFRSNSDRTKFWKEYYRYIDKIEFFNFYNRKAYAIYFSNIVVVEFDPIGAIFIYKRNDFVNIIKQGIIFENQLKDRRLYICKINHTYGWQYKVRDILKYYNIKLI